MSIFLADEHRNHLSHLDCSQKSKFRCSQYMKLLLILSLECMSKSPKEKHPSPLSPQKKLITQETTGEKNTTTKNHRKHFFCMILTMYTTTNTVSSKADPISLWKYNLNFHWLSGLWPWNIASHHTSYVQVELTSLEAIIMQHLQNLARSGLTLSWQKWYQVKKATL